MKNGLLVIFLILSLLGSVLASANLAPDAKSAEIHEMDELHCLTSQDCQQCTLGALVNADQVLVFPLHGSEFTGLDSPLVSFSHPPEIRPPICNT